MKDIIASQHVRRRKKGYHSFIPDRYHMTEQSFIYEQQHPGKRKKSPLARLSPGANPLFKLKGLPVQKYFPMAGSILLILGTLGALNSRAFIPPPEPPEDALLREVLVGGVSPRTAAPEGDAIPLDLTETFAWQEYRVQPGDSVEAIARRYGLSLDAVIASNGLRNVRRELQAGQKIRIPNMDGIPYTVRSGDSYERIARAMDVPLEAVLDANDIQDGSVQPGAVLFIPGAKMDRNELRRALGELFVIPVSGRQTSSFGWRADPFTGVRSFHAGLDLASPFGTPVRAAADGKVSAVGYNTVYGHFVILSHGDDYQTMYAHLSRILVNKGAGLNQGTPVGRVGSSGRSTGAHLHFSVYKNGRAVNPLEVLNK